MNSVQPPVDTCVLHEDAFYAFFSPIPQTSSQLLAWGGIGLETYGKDLEKVRSHDPDFIWTVIDDGSGDQWLVSGIQFVNRICFVVTEQSHFSRPIHFRIARNSRPLSALGLRRQLNKLKRHLGNAEAIS